MVWVLLNLHTVFVTLVKLHIQEETKKLNEENRSLKNEGKKLAEDGMVDEMWLKQTGEIALDLRSGIWFHSDWLTNIWHAFGAQ